jgi:DNA/RNA-binding domain of Phe-tRNA-synthetase-like protein
MVTEQAQELLGIIYAPVQTPTAALDEAMSRLAERLTLSAGAKTVDTRVVPGELE